MGWEDWKTSNLVKYLVAPVMRLQTGLAGFVSNKIVFMKACQQIINLQVKIAQNRTCLGERSAC